MNKQLYSVFIAFLAMAIPLMPKTAHSQDLDALIEQLKGQRGGTEQQKKDAAAALRSYQDREITPSISDGTAVEIEDPLVRAREIEERSQQKTTTDAIENRPDNIIPIN